MFDRIEVLNNEVLFTREPVTLIQPMDIAKLKERAARNPRQRIRLCTHQNAEAPLHEMIILHGRSAYVRPHFHAYKPESFMVLEGQARFFLFDEQGKVTRAEEIGVLASGSICYGRIEPGQYHSLIITSDWLVFHEATLGPFNRQELCFAPWAPDDSDPQAVQAYLNQLLAQPLTQPLPSAAL